MDFSDVMDGLDPDAEDFRERFERNAYKAFLLFEEGVEYDKKTGGVSIDPAVQADIVMGVINLRRDIGMVVNALAALKYILRNELEPPYPPRLEMALNMADSIVPDPQSVDVYTVNMDDPDEVMN